MKQEKAAIYISISCLTTMVASYLFWDIPIAGYCRELNPAIIQIADIITRLGVSTWYIIVSALMFLVFRFIYKNNVNAMRSLFVLLSVSLAGIFVNLLKWIGGRFRPIELFNHGLYGFGFFKTGYEYTSFPSGHAQTAFSLAMALTLLFPRWGIPLFAMAAVVALSRIVLTAHYLSDAIAGAGVGLFCALAIKYIFDRKQIELTRKTNIG